MPACPLTPDRKSALFYHRKDYKPRIRADQDESRQALSNQNTVIILNGQIINNRL